MAEPNFIIGGAVASGTSFLSHTIKDHPQIYLPKIMRPECGFFYKSWEFSKGKDYYLQRWFTEAKEQKAVGERSSLYFHGDFMDVPKRIHDMYPDMKLIFCLRNPTERAYANYRFTALCGLENLSFQDALEQEEDREKQATGIWAEIRPFSYRKRGQYADQLKAFFEVFPRRQILCIKSETLSKKTPEILKQVFHFLGVDESYMAPPQENFTSPNVKNLWVQTLLRKWLRGPKLDQITENYRKGSRTWTEKIAGWNLTEGKKPMPAEDRKRLQDFYSSHNERLAKLLDWDVSDW
ncbi:MAG: sulfotransferase domain-containing protein [Patescibacteria group bacterium]